MAIGTLVGQVIGSLFGLFMLYYTFLNYKKKQFTANEFMLWVVLWALFMIISLFPGILNPLVEITGVLRALDLLTIVGFIFLILAVFYNYTLIRRNQKQLEAVVREVALKSRKK